jgi:Zn-finger nucleic acid-binding protein
MNCPNCGAAMRFDKARECLSCEFCGDVRMLDPDPDGVAMLGTASPLECPVCAIPLTEAAVHGRQLLCCSRCRGLLIPMDGFVGLTWDLRSGREPSPEPPPAFDPRGLRRTIPCPQCRKRMDTHLYAGPGNVIIDSCSRCHLDWLDRGELQRIASAPDHARTEDDGPWAP